MKFQYVGVGNEDPQTIVFYGHEFKLNGEFVDVTAPDVIQKMQGIRTFEAEVVDDDLEALKAEATEKGIIFHHKIGAVKLRALIEKSE